ncbi:MAG: hypothetical protein EOP02_00050 [Proteobacteria bacterium]|nr:MAG: hypothetical protein EOP02_00050 [Pseudomonadota bacterium]
MRPRQLAQQTGTSEELFIPLANYTAPPVPTQALLRSVIGRIQALLVRDQPKPFIADDRLKKATMDMLDEVVAPPACGPLIAELDRTVVAWMREQPSASSVKVVVMPPCDENAIIDAWARQAGHQIIASPDRDQLIKVPPPPLPDLQGDGLLVVPRLEAWFIRHRSGLQAVRHLLAALDASTRPIVIGCNSWAWTFLSKATDADLMLPDAVTFVAFDEMRLHRWFGQLATAEETGGVLFRRATTGSDVLELDEDGTPQDDYLRTLAGRSLGIPWVAWHMWRRSLRSRGDDAPLQDAKAMLSSEKDAVPGMETLWVTALDEYVLPGREEQSALLVLQALLIHGPLNAGHLRLVLPLVGESNIVSVLVQSGFLERKGNLFSVCPAAYPTVRAGLSSAGLPMDRA